MNALLFVVAVNSWMLGNEVEVSGSAASASTSSAPSTSTTEVTDPEAVQDLLYFTPRRPFLIRIHAYVNGKGFRNLRRQWAEAQFAVLDLNRNDVLEGDEIKAVPSRTDLRPTSANDYSPMGPVDSDPADGKVTLEEFCRYLIEAAGPSFAIISTDNPRDRRFQPNSGNNPQVNLFPKLDTNRDGKLSKQELDSAAMNMRRYDRNEDDIIDNNELQQSLPEEQINSQQQLSGALGMLQVVDTSDGGLFISRRLLESYDKASRDPVSKLFHKDEKLAPNELPIDQASFQRADQNGDGKLDRKELAQLSAQMTPDLELEIQAPSMTGDFFLKPLREGDTEVASIVGVNQEPNGQWSLSLGDTSFDLHADSPPANLEEVLRSLYTQRFRNLDRDKNEYLDLSEMRRAGFNDMFFNRADVDKDENVYEREYLAEVIRQIEFSKSIFSMEISSNGPSLFRLIDVNPADGRLSLRELSEAPSRFAKWDKNNDGSISLAELSIKLQATFKAGTPRVNGPFNPQDLPISSVRGARGIRQAIGSQMGSSRPEWFTKMDRNSDGDLSPNEFLGRRALFDKFDTNHDGLISPTEAIEASRETKQ